MIKKSGVVMTSDFFLIILRRMAEEDAGFAVNGGHKGSNQIIQDSTYQMRTGRY
jgi:hypothetical protein